MFYALFVYDHYFFSRRVYVNLHFLRVNLGNYNGGHKILRIFDTLLIFLFTTSKTIPDY